MTTALSALAVLVAGIILFFSTAWVFPGVSRGLWWLLLHGAYRMRVYHRERFPATGAVLLVGNHASYIDWMLVWLASPRPVRFVIWSGYYHNPLLRFFLSFVRHHSVRIDNRTTSPHAVGHALQAVTAALDAGEVVLLFPEGRLTRNGQMRPFGRGLEHILKKTTAPVTVIPLGISGMWGSVFSHKGGRILRKWPESLRRRVRVIFGVPMAKTESAAEIRAAVTETLADLAIVESNHDMMVPQWYVHTAAKWRNMFRRGMVDNAGGSERVLSIGQGFVAAWCLCSWQV